MTSTGDTSIPDEAVHASCVVVGTAGVLIRGPSGTGKSALTMALIERFRRIGAYAVLVSDDRTILIEANGRMLASAPASIEGLIELRGRGIRNHTHLPSTVVRLIIDLLPARDIERMPDCEALIVRLGNLELPRQPVPERDVVLALPLVEAALHDLDG